MLDVITKDVFCPQRAFFALIIRSAKMADTVFASGMAIILIVW